MDTITGSFDGQLHITYVRGKYKVHRGNSPAAQSRPFVTLHGCLRPLNIHPGLSLLNWLWRCPKRRCTFTMLRNISRTAGRFSHSRICITAYTIEGSAAREVLPNTFSKMWGRTWYSTVKFFTRTRAIQYSLVKKNYSQYCGDMGGTTWAFF